MEEEKIKEEPKEGSSQQEPKEGSTETVAQPTQDTNYVTRDEFNSLQASIAALADIITNGKTQTNNSQDEIDEGIKKNDEIA